MTDREPPRTPARGSPRPTAGSFDAPRLSAGGIDALRYAGQRQLTRWGARRLTLRNEQRRTDLVAAMTALRTLKRYGCDCELRRLPPDA